jgi:hypothetical protein
VVIVNGQPTKMDRYADTVLLGSLSELLPALCGPGDSVAESRPTQ